MGLAEDTLTYQEGWVEADPSEFTMASFFEKVAKMRVARETGEPYTVVLNPDQGYHLLVVLRDLRWLDMEFRVIRGETAGQLEERWRRKQGRRR
jgi:hypothetical protein